MLARGLILRHGGGRGPLWWDVGGLPFGMHAKPGNSVGFYTIAINWATLNNPP